MLLVEKYRPKSFKEIVGVPEEIEKFMKEEVIPPFLFSGPPGTGKTSTARVMAKTLGGDFMQLNASDETGIDTVRNKISKFAMGVTTQGKRVILLDEVDGMTMQAQQNLRGTIDKYQSNCVFIMTCNFDWKIIEPLKDSRAIHIKFERPPLEFFKGRIKYIAKQEEIELSDLTLDKLTAYNYPDMRKTIMELERLSLKHGKKISENDVETNSLNILVLIELLKNKKLNEAMTLVDEKYTDVEKLMADLSDEFWNGNYTQEKKVKLFTEIMRRAYVEICRVKNNKLILRPMLYEIMTVL